jgi:translocation and assembly module TamA
MWTWRRIDNLLDPRAGTVLQLSVGGGAKAALSDQNFVRLHGRIQHYLPVGARDTLVLRGELGRTFADSRLRIPQDYLFRAGGTGSVRGYAYQSLGIKEGEATVGGRYLAVASAEYTHWLNNDWGLALFVDAGDAVDGLKDVRLATGYGLGVRWRSPAGPIGADLAYGEREARLQLHFSLAIPF